MIKRKTRRKFLARSPPGQPNGDGQHFFPGPLVSYENGKKVKD